MISKKKFSNSKKIKLWNEKEYKEVLDLWNEKEYKEVLDLWNSGYKYKEIAEELSRSIGSVSGMIKILRNIDSSTLYRRSWLYSYLLR